jgi:hypothetical protein
MALGIEHAKRMSHIIICGLPGSPLFSTLSHKLHDFRKKKTFLGTKSVFQFSLQPPPPPGTISLSKKK